MYFDLPSSLLTTISEPTLALTYDQQVVVQRAGLAKPRYEKRELVWVPSTHWCKQLRAEMGELSKLHVGEWIIEGGGTAGNS